MMEHLVAHRAQPAAPPSVLVVEDSGLEASDTEAQLHSLGYVVSATVGSADEARDVVSLRWRTSGASASPGEDGYSFMRRVRALPAAEGRDVRALALTALAGDGDLREALDAGFQLHLAKPVGIDRLTAAVVELLAPR
jgi:CheY-like chemotaxis protein